jgi:hypothetical protein
MQIQTGLTIATEMAATGRAAWLSGHGIGIHANQLGESAYGESGSLKLDEKLSVRHQRSPPHIF